MLGRGPAALLLLLHMVDLFDVVASNGAQVHLYADDVQLYVSSPAHTTIVTTLHGVRRRCLDARQSAQLQPAEDAADLAWFPAAARQVNRRRHLDAVCCCIRPQSTVRDLGVTLDSQLTLLDHVTKGQSRCMLLYQLRRLPSVIPSLMLTPPNFPEQLT